MAEKRERTKSQQGMKGVKKLLGDDMPGKMYRKTNRRLDKKGHT